MTYTRLTPERLAELHAEGNAWHASSGPFIDPCRVAQVTAIMTQRGEGWAEAVLLRRFTARSRLVPSMPAFQGGELEILILADKAETDALLAAAGPDTA